MRKRRKHGKKAAKLVFHYERVASMGCLVSGEHPVTLHHVTASIYGGRQSRSDRLIVPLAARYHLIQHGPRESVEALGHGGFYHRYGIDLLMRAAELWHETEALWEAKFGKGQA